MTRVLIIAMALALAAPAFAQTNQHRYYGSSGQYLGRSTSNGADSRYYGDSGQYLGRSTSPTYPSYNDSTRYYGSSGQYLGQTRR